MITCAVLDVLDSYGAQYFDFCEADSATLQNCLEAAIRRACIRFAEDLNE